MTEKSALLQIGKVSDRMAEQLAASFDVHRLMDEKDPECFLDDNGDRFVAVATMSGLPPEVMERLPNLKVVSSFGVGYDTIDAEACAAQGIIVSHTPDVLNDEVADTALMLWLAVSRELVPSERWARSGVWEEKGAYPLSRSVRNRTVGIVGLGRIGQTIAEQAAMFNATVVYHSRSAKDVPYRYFADLTEMARASDVLIVITPGGPETKHLVNAEVIEALGREGILINVARGSVVDEAAVADALANGRLGGAGLDVFEQEPTIHEALKSLDNVVLLPHVGSATVETRQAMGDLVCDNLDQWVKDGTVKTPVPECKHLNGD